MERLTKIDGAGRNIIEVRKFYEDDDWIISEMADGITIRFYSKATDKLSQFEDFMEANKFKSIEELQNAINGKFENIFDEKHKIWIKVIEDKTYVEKRNRILEERWQKLREWLRDRKSENGSKYFDNEMIEDDNILDKMQELEIKE